MMVARNEWRVARAFRACEAALATRHSPLATLAALVVAVTASADVTLTFPAALERATRATSIDQAAVLDGLPLRTLPVVRAETAFSSAENLNLLSERVDRFDAFTAVVSVDYPLLAAGADRRRAETLRADGQILRRRALDDAETVFRETLDAFARLYLAEERIRLLHDGDARAAALRERARTMLDAGEISNLTAAQWQDQTLATESALVDLELQRLEAETRLKQLIGDTTDETLHAVLTLDDQPAVEIAADEPDPGVRRAALALQEASAQRRPQLLLSAFGGVAAVPATDDADDGTFGIYGVRLSLSLPMFEAAAARRVAEARLQLEEATRVQDVAEAARRNRIELLRFALTAAEKRLGLLEDAVGVANRRRESISRLVLAGVRTEADLVAAANEIARRESDLLAMRVERWKIRQLLQRAGAALP